MADSDETDLDALPDGASCRAPEASRMYLVVGREDGSSRVIVLAEGVAITFGRASDVTVPIDDRRVSRRQAIVRRCGDVVMVEDLGSRNGTLVNGEPLRAAEARLRGGDVLRIGPWDIVLATAGSRGSELAAGEGPVESRGMDGIVVADPAMRKVFSVVQRLARTQTTVLIAGETGAGKEVVAEAIHRASARAGGPFVRLNCGALPESLLESELFGYERGAFTGADRRKAGFYEAAHGGTLLLDEIGDMPLTMQVKLLVVLEGKEVTRLGGTRAIPVDVRVLCATNRDLEADVAAGRFREDLFYRISTFTLTVPPLRERPAEIALLAHLFTRDFARGAERPEISPETLMVLREHRWPGNVRELRNAIEHAMVLADGGIVLPEHLPPSVRSRSLGASMPVPLSATLPIARGPLPAELALIEKRNIEAALASFAGNQTRAAEHLGISRRTLIYKMAKYHLRPRRS